MRSRIAGLSLAVLALGFPRGSFHLKSGKSRQSVLLGRARVDSEKITTAKMGGWYMADKNCIPFVGTLCFVAGRLAVLSLASTVAAVAQNPLPAINLPLVPDAVTPGGAGFTLTVNGTGFVSGAVVNWNGSARTTTFINASSDEFVGNWQGHERC